MPIASNELRNILTFDDLIQYLEEKLDWPLHEYGFDELTFEYLPEELGLKDIEAAKIGRIHQLRPLSHSQPWGIFFVEFEKKKLPVVVLRRILSHLVLKKRASANKSREAAWDTEDLLFITAFGEVENQQREIAFAHFHQTPGDLPTLRVLGWDGADTPLKLAHVDAILREQLLWPDNPSDLENWRQQWREPFKHRIGHVINTASTLAEVLAVLARGIRDRSLRMLSAESEKGPLRKLHKAFQTSLIHDLTEESFADTYAQTITYGLLTAAISRTDDNKQRTGTFVADNLHDLVPITNPFLREMLQTFLKVGGRKGGIDFDELGIQDVVDLLRGDETDLPAILRDFGNRTRGEDPVIHFYGHFLTTYNKRLKIQRGAFYTPQPVVSYIIRSVHELLQTEFGLEDGLASTVTWGEMKQQNSNMTIPTGISPESPFVMILDIATGTGTFLVEVIDVIHKTMTIKWQKQGKREQEIVTLWNEYVPKHLLPRLYGYELMMAPYAIAHMKIGLKLFETGYLFMSDARVRVYLTNTLEPPSDLGQQDLVGIFPALAHEADAVNRIKRFNHFTVLIGNPPYSVSSINKSIFIEEKMEIYKEDVREEKNIQPLSDDYIKFIRFAHLKINQSGIGIVGMITNNSFLSGSIHRGMRRRLLDTFNTCFFLNLHGNSRIGEKCQDGGKDDNVFDIQQGVSISSLIKHFRINNIIRYADCFGLRSKKYQFLEESSVISFNKWNILKPSEPYYFFFWQNVSVEADEYKNYPSLRDIFSTYSSGVNTMRDNFLVHFEVNSLKKNLEAFSNPTKSKQELENEYGIKDTRDWSIDKARKNFTFNNKFIVDYDYRPFDMRHLYYDEKLIDRGCSRKSMMINFIEQNNLGLAVSKSYQSKRIFDSVMICNKVSDGHFASDRSYIFPLYLEPQHDELKGELPSVSGRCPNLRQTFLDELRKALKLEQTGHNSLPTGITPEDIFQYAYAIFHSPNYRSRYAELLKFDFPRLPLTSSMGLFRALGQLGWELVALHLMESPKLNNHISTFIGGKMPEVEKVSYSDETVWINKTKSEGFRGVSEKVWNFHIGGYQVCEKWLKARKGRILTEDDINHYHRIVGALSETIRLMSEIDEVIDSHGGWPGAFQNQEEP